jgi:hypothetical protein
MDIEITDIIPDLIQTVTGPFVIGSGIWAHESILTTSDNPRFHGSITISDCDIRDFAFPSSENAPILVNDFDQSTIPITIEDNSVGGTNVLFGIATVGLVTPTTWILGNDIDATDALGGLSVRVHPAGIPGEIHIEDNTVKGGFFGMLWFFAPAGGSTVRDNRIRDSFIGIALHGSNSHDFDDNRITDVVFGIRLGLQDVFPFPIPSVPSNGSTFSDILVSGTEWGLYVTEGATGNVFCDPGFKDVNVPIFEDAGTSSIFACVIPVDIDIKFCSNPNAHNCRSGGALPVTIFGAADLDVADIDLASLQLCRADGGGCTSTTSGDGVIDSSIYDRGTPGDRGFGTAECTIIEDPPGSGILEEVGNPDGFLDLDAAFDKSAVSALLDICDDSGSKGDSSVALFIQGSLLDGTQIISTPIGDDGIDQLVKKNR